MSKNMITAERLKQCRISADKTLEQIGTLVGVHKTTVMRWENGETERISLPTIQTLADYYNVNPAWLMGADVPMTSKNIAPNAPEITDDVVTFPVIGELAAGYDRLSYEDYDTFDSIEVPLSYLKGRPKSDFFVLKIHGSSMYPLYMNDDRVLIKKTPTLERSGDIGVIQYEDCATLKKIEFVPGEDWLKLVPINPSYEPQTISGYELEQCKVIGVPVFLMRELEQ